MQISTVISNADEIGAPIQGCILHFGMHKTGSSSIQKSLFNRLNDPGFHYVNLGSPNPSAMIATGFLDDPAKYHVNRKRGVSKRKLQNLRLLARSRLDAELRFAQSNGKTAILSAEDLSMLAGDELRVLCDEIAGHVGDIIAVGYVRAPKGFMESLLQQKIKSGAKGLDVAASYPNYRLRFEKFESVLGKGKVRYWRFDSKAFPGGCVVRDFCSRLGIRFPAEDVVRVNEGLSLPALSLLLAYRKFGPGYGVGATVIRENILLIERIAQLQGPKLRLHSKLISPVLDANSEDIVWIERRLGASLREDLTADDGHSVHSLEDLLKFAPETLLWLAEQLGPEYIERCRPGMFPREVATWMHALRWKPWSNTLWVEAGEARSKTITNGDVDMNMKKWVQRAKQASPKLLEKLPDDSAVALVQEVFKQISAEIDATNEGEVKVRGFGRFRVRQVEQEKDGQKTNVKRTVFQPASNKGEGE